MHDGSAEQTSELLMHMYVIVQREQVPGLECVRWARRSATHDFRESRQGIQFVPKARSLFRVEARPLEYFNPTCLFAKRGKRSFPRTRELPVLPHIGQ